MVGRLDHFWRVLRAGLCFAVFGVGAIAVAYVVAPLRQRSAGGSADPEVAAQCTVHGGARLFVAFARALGMVSLETEGIGRLRDGVPRVVVANHPTLIDMVILASLMPQADCLVSRAWAANPFLRRLVRVAGYVCNDSGTALVRGCLERLRAGRTVVIFPEGTRSPVGGLGPFRPGAAFAALRSGRELLPVRITCSPSSLTKGRSWYDLPNATLHFTVRADEPISPGAVPSARGRYGAIPVPRAARLLTAELHELIRKGLERVDYGST